MSSAYLPLIGRHEAYFKSRGAQTIHLPSADRDVHLKQGELLNIEWSYKVKLHPSLCPGGPRVCRSTLV